MGDFAAETKIVVEFPWDGEPTAELCGAHVRGSLQLSFAFGTVLIKSQLGGRPNESD
jgi:hypothetical protein